MCTSQVPTSSTDVRSPRCTRHRVSTSSTDVGSPPCASQVSTSSTDVRSPPRTSQVSTSSTGAHLGSRQARPARTADRARRDHRSRQARPARSGDRACRDHGSRQARPARLGDRARRDHRSRQARPTFGHRPAHHRSRQARPTFGHRPAHHRSRQARPTLDDRTSHLRAGVSFERPCTNFVPALALLTACSLAATPPTAGPDPTTPAYAARDPQNIQAAYGRITGPGGRSTTRRTCRRWWPGPTSSGSPSCCSRWPRRPGSR